MTKFYKPVMSGKKPNMFTRDKPLIFEIATRTKYSTCLVIHLHIQKTYQPKK